MDKKEIYHQTSLSCSAIITQNYGSSFTLGMYMLDKKYHAAIYAIYGFVRIADEIVDMFLGHNRRQFLENLKRETYEAINNRLSFNPVLHAFQMTVNKYRIEMDLIEAFITSMEMDLYLKEYDEAKYQEYIYGSAEVVGLMCLRVFCEGDEKLYRQLEEPARKLGSAFQKVNFLRDIKSDFEERGRMYFPGVDYKNFDETSKIAIEKSIQEDFYQAAPGIKRLPEGARTGVQIASIYFGKLFQKIRNLPPETITQKRVSISYFQKMSIMMSEKCLYITLLLSTMIISVFLSCTIASPVNYSAKWSSLFPAICLSAVFFILWDSVFTHCGVWRFNSRYVVGINAFGLPIEEWMFFFIVPYSCVFIYESLNFLVPINICQPLAKPFFYLLIPILLSTSLLKCDKIYTCINALIAVGLISTHIYVFGDRLLGRFLFALIIHYIPFFIFNGILTGGAATEEPVVIYNAKAITNFRIKTIPIEDTVYSMSLFLMNVSFFEWFLM